MQDYNLDMETNQLILTCGYRIKGKNRRKGTKSKACITEGYGGRRKVFR